MANVHLAVRGRTTHPAIRMTSGVKKGMKRRAWKRFRAAVRDSLRHGYDPDMNLPRPMSLWDIT
jgi:hypothetical protein